MEGGESSRGTALPRPDEFDDLFSEEAWALMSEEARRMIIKISEDHEEGNRRRLQRRQETQERMNCRVCRKVRKAGPPRPDNPSNSLTLSRDVRDSDQLLWCPKDRTRDLPESLLGPMRYTSCELGDRCFHVPHPMIQIFGVSVQFYTQALMKVMGDDNTSCPRVDVYGLIAVRDSLDSSRNYIFHRSREDAQAIDVNGGYLRLRNPDRGISATGCSIEIDIKIKGKDAEEDLTIIDGSLKALGLFDPWSTNHVDNINGRITFKSCVVREGVQATIELDFVEVPLGGFHVRMFGKTVLSKGYYSFINKCCRDADGFVPSTGKHAEKFVAVVNIGDTLLINFMEEGKEALPFVASKHGNQQRLHQFRNGAVVSVTVYWSTIVTRRGTMV